MREAGQGRSTKGHFLAREKIAKQPEYFCICPLARFIKRKNLNFPRLHFLLILMLY